jgi:hypothetical protein
VVLADDTLAWELGPDGQWRKLEPTHYVDAHITLRGLAEARVGTRTE